jgi:hypothetical protein
MTQETNATLPNTPQELFKALVTLHTQMNEIKDDIKTLKSDLKEAGSELDFAGIAKVAAKASLFKTEEAKADAEEFIALVEELT